MLEKKSHLSLSFTHGEGLRITLKPQNGPAMAGLPVRLELRGSTLFKVWTWADSGETSTAWAEADFNVSLFSGEDGESCKIEELYENECLSGFRVSASRTRIAAEMLICIHGETVSFDTCIRNPQGLGGTSLPLAEVEFRIGPFYMGSDAEFLSAHAYGGRTHCRGRLDELQQKGIPFRNGCTGLALPLLYVFDSNSRNGLEFEFMSDSSIDVFLRPEKDGKTLFSARWQPERLLAPGVCHHLGEPLKITPYQGPEIQRMRDWRDNAEQRYAIKSPDTPDWAKKMNIIEFNTNLCEGHHPFQRLDDPKVRELLEDWKSKGYTAIFTVGHNNTGKHFLSPFNYDPAEKYGGEKGEQQYLNWAHELGFKVFLWITTVGMDRNAPEVHEHADWWTHRIDGSLFYAWDSNPKNAYVGYAPDANPLSSGWRNWLKNQTSKIISRGFDGVYVDGCIPRAANHANWDWPGQARNGVPDQVVDLARHVRSLGEKVICFVEDEGLYTQACADVTQGRYLPMNPMQRIGAEDMMTGIGPAEMFKVPRIAPEEARDYLQVRYASLLPGTVSNDILEGYWSEATRPWTVQSLFAGCVPKTHSQYIDYGAAENWELLHKIAGDTIIQMGEPPCEDRRPERRKAGTEEFFSLLRFCRDEDLIHDAEMSIEAVALEGDPAVVGILRPGKGRCLLALINFANRRATVNAKLAEAIDIAPERRTGSTHQKNWAASEMLRSFADSPELAGGRIGPKQLLHVELAAFGFKIFSLTESICS